jgi:hypothetical protein
MSDDRLPNHDQNEFTSGAILHPSTNLICHKLPVEIWCQIFEECVAHVPRTLLPLSRSSDKPEQRKHPYTNVAISHVCRYFRHIALSTPAMWSTLNLDGSKSEVKTFLERSKQLPITITSIRDQFLRGYFLHSNTFATISERIVSIETLVGESNLKIIAPCKNLKHVMLGEGQKWSDRLHIEKILNQFESLETLWWKNIFCDLDAISLQNQHHLCSLNLFYKLSDTFLLSVLRCCPALENISALVIGTKDTLNDDPVHLPRLRDLRLQFFGEDSWVCKLDVPTILDHFEFSYWLPYPSLSSQQWNMRMSSLVLGPHENTSLMVSWLANETGALRTLTMGMPQVLHKPLLKALQANGLQTLCPNLEQVHVPFMPEFKTSFTSPGYTRSDYEELFYDISSSRIQAGLPPLRFTLDGVLVVPKEKVLPEPAAGISSTEEHIPHALPNRRNNLLGRVSNALPDIKGITQGKIRKSKLFR